MGCASSVVGCSSTGPWVSLKEARACSSNPFATSARYHKEGERVLADDYDVTSISLGEGMSGTVVLAFGKLDGQRYAVKRFVKGGMSAAEKKLRQREVEIYLAVDHPLIARLSDVYETTKELVLVMECCTGGELFTRVLEQKKLTEHEAAVAMRQMLHAIGYLHSHKIVHRDLKLENWLYESKEAEAQLKLIDFGFAEVWGPGMPNMRRGCGAVGYLSPDVFYKQGYTSKRDLWSMGVIVFILLSGYMPFSGDDTTRKVAICEGKVDWRHKAWSGVSAEALDFVKALLAFDPEHRSDASTALAHPWLVRLAVPEAPMLSKLVVLSMQEYAGAPRLRRAALQLLSRELLPEESREMTQLFLGLNQSTSGTVPVHELVGALCELRREQADEEVRSSSLQSLMPEKAWDRSPSSAATEDTDPQGWSRSSSPGSESSVGSDVAAAEELACCFDTNGDGDVYCSDFMAATLGSQPWLRQKAVERAFARLDVDRSGSIGTEDLRQALGGPFEGVEAGALLASAGIPLDPRGEVSLRAFAALVCARDDDAGTVLHSGTGKLAEALPAMQRCVAV